MGASRETRHARSVSLRGCTAALPWERTAAWPYIYATRAIHDHVVAHGDFRRASDGPPSRPRWARAMPAQRVASSPAMPRGQRARVRIRPAPPRNGPGMSASVAHWLATPMELAAPPRSRWAPKPITARFRSPLTPSPAVRRRTFPQAWLTTAIEPGGGRRPPEPSRPPRRPVMPARG